jgi:cell wall-associated NlpC family hydrolase
MSAAHIPARRHSGTNPLKRSFAARAAVALTALVTLAVAPAGALAAPASHARVATTRHAPVRATSRRSASVHARHVAKFRAKADRVITEARKQRGKPYVYGGDGPHSFDCSGLVRYVFLHSLGRSLPHNAAEQYRVSHHISRSHLRVGDLVFVDNGGYVSHVGIFAGHHHWWVAPHTGSHVKLQRIYSAHFVYGRVIHWPGSH